MKKQQVYTIEWNGIHSRFYNRTKFLEVVKRCLRVQGCTLVSTRDVGEALEDKAFSGFYLGQ